MANPFHRMLYPSSPGVVQAQVRMPTQAELMQRRQYIKGNRQGAGTLAPFTFTPQAVQFAVGAHLVPSGNVPPADSPFLSFSLWTKSPTTAFNFGPDFFILPSNQTFGALSFENVAGDLAFFAASGVNNFFQVSSGAVMSANIWYNILGSMDTNHSSGSRIVKLYVSAYGAVSDTPVTLGGSGSVDSGVAFSIPFTSINQWATTVFAGPNSMTGVVGYSDIWWAPGQFVDWSVTATRRKVIDANGKPVFLGANGELVTGTKPFAFFSGPAATFATNLGSGDTFSATGPITNTTGPS